MVVSKSKRIILVLILIIETTIANDCARSYGKYCPYVPAITGRTPQCARPGQTFCESPEGYPRELIAFLAKQARFNHATLVTDETKDEFSATIGPYPAANYPTDYRNIDITTITPQNRPFHEETDNSNMGRNISRNNFKNLGYYPEMVPPPIRSQFHNYKYTSDISSPLHNRDDISSAFMHQPSSWSESGMPFRTNFLWKRNVNKFANYHTRVKRSELFRRHVRKARESNLKKNFKGEIKYKRNKRQSGGLEGETLCQTRTNFIMPKAALNKDGVWMYVVNMEENSEKYTQLVKSEVCASQTCSSLCGLPLGYTSKCEQKYIQKRLIALQGEGDQLYTDVFWIPSCCVCTIKKT